MQLNEIRIDCRFVLFTILRSFYPANSIMKKKVKKEKQVLPTFPNSRRSTSKRKKEKKEEMKKENVIGGMKKKINKRELLAEIKAQCI